MPRSWSIGSSRVSLSVGYRVNVVAPCRSLLVADDRCGHDHLIGRIEDLAGRLWGRALEEVRGDRRGARRDVVGLAVEVELDLVADRGGEPAHGDVRARREACLVAPGREVVPVHRGPRAVRTALAGDDDRR